MFTPTIIDIEASGFGKGSYPIEVGFITADKQVKCSLIKPESGWVNWCPEAEKIHGIDRSILIKKGKPIREIASWLNTCLDGQTVYSDAWLNDMCWLGRLYEEAELSQSFRLESILSLLNEAERELWSEIYQCVLTDTKLIRHRASTDAKLIQETYLRIKQICPDQKIQVQPKYL
jgi:hypothetical protein